MKLVNRPASIGIFVFVKQTILDKQKLPVMLGSFCLYPIHKIIAVTGSSQKKHLHKQQ
ncbi:hypothetical protein FHS14_001890 [Paenibacillus baekrokdamisoli]|nr:hypothetical protein [Paenibacillus baekrokdamisoli]